MGLCEVTEIYSYVGLVPRLDTVRSGLASRALRECLGLGFRVQGSGFRVQGVGFRVQDSGFRVQSSGFSFTVQGVRI